MKRSKIILIVLALSLVWGGVSPALAQNPGQSAAGLQEGSPQAPDSLAPDSVDMVPVLACNGTGISGDQAALRGIVFTVSQGFSAVEVRMAGAVAGTYFFTAELRRSSGFTGPADYSQNVSIDLPLTGAPPYKPVHIDFGNIPVAGAETFSLRFTNFDAPGLSFFETFGIGNKPCPNVMETEENNVAVPSERGDPAGFKALAPNPGSLPLTSTYAGTPPTIDGRIDYGEWNLANKIPFDNGFISVVNDNIRLYVLLDVLGETVNNPIDSDFFWVTFDKDRDGAIDANADLNYGTAARTNNMRYQFYTGPNTWTGLQPDTYSSRGRGFGCFWSDGTFTLTSIFPLRFTCSQHRVYELAFDLGEINSSPGGQARMGVRVNAAAPAFTNDTPANFSADFSELISISLAPSPYFIIAPFPGAQVFFANKSLEVTQAVQDLNNSLPLVADKTSVARVYVQTGNVPFAQMAKTYLYGSVGGVDLPGSPMAVFKSAPTLINRNNLNNTANFQLPTTWDQGSVNFSVKAIDLLNHTAAAGPVALAFTPKSAPTYWVVPINTNSVASPNTVSNSFIANQESYLKAIYPLSNVNFVQKPWTVIGVTTVNDTISDLNNYYTSAVLAWILTVLFTGNQPFVLPDQIYGATPSGGGISDPTWIGGIGRVARGFLGTSLEGTMAHEINHNLDRSATGTWGHHTPFGCGAVGPDPTWPYADSNINEIGFDTRLPWSTASSPKTVVPNTNPDIMSYCQSGYLPTKWISPYRWTNLFNNFPTALNQQMLEKAADIQTVYYVSGQLNDDGTGSLNPVLVQPGIPSTDIPKGDYGIQILDANGTPVSSTPFNAQFIVDPEEESSAVYFNFQIPAPTPVPGLAPLAGMQIQLTHGADILDEITQSDNAPTISITAPAGGEQWSGVQTVTWDASDLDGDPLSFTVLYSPDNGTNWNPLASGVQANQLDVDIDQLPGGAQAIFRVIVSDGFNNTQADSQPITVGDNSPQVTILAPIQGTVVAPGTTVDLSGDATDPEDASIPDESFVWSEGEDVLGSGRQASANLAPGLHNITLSVMDSQGNTGQETTTVLVTLQTHLPLMFKP